MDELMDGLCCNFVLFFLNVETEVRARKDLTKRGGMLPVPMGGTP